MRDARVAQQMYREIKEQGYTGSDTAVGRFVAPLRAGKGQVRSFKSVEPEPATMVSPEDVKKKRPPTARQVAHWMIFKEQGASELQSFGNGLKKDDDAVKAGLTLVWSNGQTEGQVHRLKLIKRQMYGRGSFTLLRKRLLHRAETKRRKLRIQKQLRGLGRKPGHQAALAS